MIGDALAGCKTLDEATIAFRDLTRPLGVRDVVYGYMLEAKSYIKHDVCFSVTICDKLMAEYEFGGGLSTDPVATSLSGDGSHYEIDFFECLEVDRGPWLAQRRYIRAVLSAGYTRALTIPFHDIEKVGHGAMTLFQDRDGAPQMDPTILKPLVYDFHTHVKKNGQLRHLFNLSDKETATLRSTAAGKTASDIASSENVNIRTVELRLAKSREKLRARHTSEAIFKATNFGILFDR